MKLFLLLLPLGFVVWMILRSRAQISPAELRAAIDAGTAVLVDVREPAEWTATGVAQDAALLSLSDLRGERRAWNAFLAAQRDCTVFVYCQSGTRSAMAAAQLRRDGFDAKNAGSLSGLARAGWSVVRRGA